MNWSASAKPGAVETRIANHVRERWISIHANDQQNPVAPTSDNLARGREEYNAHCAACHAPDGSGRNRFEADFYPPIARLVGDMQQMSDAEIYFVIANGVALSGMPAFGDRHRPEELWEIILWVRHLAHLTPDERKKIRRETSDENDGHEEVMRRGRGTNIQTGETEVGAFTKLPF